MAAVRTSGLACGAILAVANSVQAESEHKFAFGLGISGLRTPQYIGSNQNSEFYIPFPYIDYRGPFLEVDRQDGIRGRLFDGTRNALKLSLDITIPVDSDENDARRGMPDLDFTLGVGPQLDTTLGWYENCRFSFRLPLRARFAFDSLPSPEYIGLTANPALDMYCAPLVAGVRVGLRGGPVFADASTVDYFYGVEPQYATLNRPPYKGQGGFAGWRVRTTASRRFGNWWLGGFLLYDDISDAVFADSPLVVQSYGTTIGAAIAWIFKSNIDY